MRLPQSVDTLEHTNQHMAAAAPVFRDSQGAVNLATERNLLVVTEDNKGIPMVRPVEEKPAGAHRSKGDKANKKQMACIGCVYSVDPHRRTPEDVVATLFRDADRSKEQPPVAQNKRYWAELSRDLGDGEVVRGQHLGLRNCSRKSRSVDSRGSCWCICRMDRHLWPPIGRPTCRRMI